MGDLLNSENNSTCPLHHVSGCSASALLLHQRARMERLMKELMLEKKKLEQLKGDVNSMEYDALQRRFRRVNSTSLIPRVRTCSSKDTHL